MTSSGLNLTSDSTSKQHEPDILVVSPWLEGGGGYKALRGVLRSLPRERVRLVVLFDGNQNLGSIANDVADFVQLNIPRSIFGVVRARVGLRKYLLKARVVYSLMRASHLVLGVGGTRRLSRIRFAATFHQLPSEDSQNVIGRMEDVIVRRATRRAGLVTAPSERAIEELVRGRFARPGRLQFEPNITEASSDGAAPTAPEVRDKIKLLFAGRLTTQKGLQHIPELLAASSIPVDLRIAGDGDLRMFVESLAVTTPPPHRVTVIGHTDDIVGELDRADALLLPSRWELNPMIIWESWSRGRPVLASTLPVFEDLAQKGPLSCFTGPDDFARILADSLTSPTWRAHAFNEGTAAFHKYRTERRRLVQYLSE